MKTIKDLRYVMYNEWSYNPPAGFLTLYFPAVGSTYAELLGPISLINDQLSSGFDDDELEGLDEACAVKATKDAITHFCWENGDLGCGCEFLVEGEEIASKVADFYESKISDYLLDDSDEENPEYRAVINNAIRNPSDYDAVMQLLDMISEMIEQVNDMKLS